MIIHQQAKRLQDLIQGQVENGLSIGFVPTMGALHNGHLSLVKEAFDNSDLVVCSIFVNPTQFNDPKDFAKYPKTLATDLDLLYKAGVSTVFVPSVVEIYPDGTLAAKSFELEGLDKRIEGKYRPGHFQGVCQVVYRLLTIVRPDKLFLGQKDYQQCMVIQKMLDVENLPTRLKICRTVREPSGLALSSRNMRLSDDQRKQAALIYEVLNNIKTKIHSGLYSQLKQEAVKSLTGGGLRVDYVEIVNAIDLSDIDDGDLKIPIVVLVAVFLGEVRLIDNMVLR